MVWMTPTAFWALRSGRSVLYLSSIWALDGTSSVMSSWLAMTSL